jgi:hypothetical protein
MFTFVIVLIIASAAAFLFLVLTERTVRHALRCPVLGTDVQLKVRVALPEGRPIEVTACSALKPPSNVVCSQRCLAPLAHLALPPRCSSGARTEREQSPAPSAH